MLRYTSISLTTSSTLVKADYNLSPEEIQAEALVQFARKGGFRMVEISSLRFINFEDYLEQVQKGRLSGFAEVLLANEVTLVTRSIREFSSRDEWLTVRGCHIGDTLFIR